jgi:hypothetical protein
MSSAANMAADIALRYSELATYAAQHGDWEEASLCWATAAKYAELALKIEKTHAKAP